MRFSLVCISSIALRSTMDQSGSQRTSFPFSIDAYRAMHSSTRHASRISDPQMRAPVTRKYTSYWSRVHLSRLGIMRSNRE